MLRFDILNSLLSCQICILFEIRCHVFIQQIVEIFFTINYFWHFRFQLIIQLIMFRSHYLLRNFIGLVKQFLNFFIMLLSRVFGVQYVFRDSVRWLFYSLELNSFCLFWLDRDLHALRMSSLLSVDFVLQTFVVHCFNLVFRRWFWKFYDLSYFFCHGRIFVDKPITSIISFKQFLFLFIFKILSVFCSCFEIHIFPEKVELIIVWVKVVQMLLCKLWLLYFFTC